MENTASQNTTLNSNTSRFFIMVDDAIESGNLVQALRLILSNFSKFPDPAPLRERVAQTLAKKGRKQDAIHILDLVARHYANAGHPSRSLAAIKQIEALQGPTHVLEDHFSTLYSIKSTYLIDEPIDFKEIPNPVEELNLNAKEPQVNEQELVNLALERASQNHGILTVPPINGLPPMPLLSLLPFEALRRVIKAMDYELVLGAQTLLKPEDTSEELIWTVSANLLMRHEDEYWRIPSCALLGLNGFGSVAVPNEFMVVSTRSAEILRLTKEQIEELDRELGDFNNRLATLRRHALSERLMSSHPLFTSLGNTERRELMEQFIGVHVDEGIMPIKQNGSSPGLFILLDGQADVVRNDDNWEITIATLEPGEVFGEIGLVSNMPSTSGVVTSSPCVLLFLGKDQFEQYALKYPPVAKYAAQLASERIRESDESLSADDLVEID